MAKNPREPKAVKALIKKHTKPIPAATLWNRILLRRSKQK